MKRFSFKPNLIKAVKSFWGNKPATGEELKARVGESFYLDVNNRVISLKEYSPVFRKVSALSGVPERVLYAVAVAKGAKEIDEADMRAYAIRLSDAFLKTNSWDEAVDMLVRKGELPSPTGQVLRAIDEEFIRSRSPMEKAKLYEDRLDEVPVRDVLLSKKAFSFHTLIIDPAEDVKSPKVYHALTFKKYKEPKDNGEIASFLLSMTPNDDWEGFKQGFSLDDAGNLIGSFKIEDGHIIVQANGREMSYSKAREVFPSLSMVVEAVMQKARELDIALERERKRKRERDISPSRNMGAKPPSP